MGAYYPHFTNPERVSHLPRDSLTRRYMLKTNPILLNEFVNKMYLAVTQNKWLTVNIC